MKTVSSSSSEGGRPARMKAKGVFKAIHKLKMKMRKKKEEKLNTTVVLRRLNKFAQQQKEVPTGAQWTEKSLPIALFEMAKRAYTKHGEQVQRGNAAIKNSDIWKEHLQTLIYKWSTCVFLCCDRSS